MVMASAWSLQLHTVSFPRRICGNVVEVKTDLGFNCYNGCEKVCWNRRKINGCRIFGVRAMADALGPDVDTKRTQESELIVSPNDKEDTPKSQSAVAKLQETLFSLPPLLVMMKRHSGASFAVGFCVAATLLVMVVKGYVTNRTRNTRPGSVADLVRRGQLRSDRRGISTALKYEDPFNNPMVKVSKGNSSVEMCGKVYKLAPVTLTKEQQAIHQKRRSRAYQWKRPTVFLREGDPIPPDVDPDTIRWIPGNHPFATTSSDIDENLAQTNVYQKHGVPFRIQAEHEAMQRRLEALQNDQKLGKLVIDPGTAKEYERPFKSNLKPEDPVEQNPTNGQVGSNPPKSNQPLNSSPSNPTSEEMQKP